jgi:Tfp pilus assembly protein PilF
LALDYSSRVPSGQQAALINEASAAAARAIQLDPKNNQAYLVQSYILPRGDLVGREALLKKAIAARPGVCGCEHRDYGWFLRGVGRTADAFVEFRRALDVAPLPPANEEAYAETLLILGRQDEAEMHFQWLDETSDELRKVELAPMTGDYAAAQKALKANRVRLGLPGEQRAFVAAYDAMISGNSAAKAKAAADLAALKGYPVDITVTMLGALGANRLALDKLEYLAASKLLWYPSMAGALRDPSFPAVANRLGLMKYWKTTRTKPDVCSAKDPPPFCSMI